MSEPPLLLLLLAAQQNQLLGGWGLAAWWQGEHKTVLPCTDCCICRLLKHMCGCLEVHAARLVDPALLERAAHLQPRLSCCYCC